VFIIQFLWLNFFCEDGAADPMLDDQLIITWAKVCQAMRAEFEPYLAVVMPPLIKVLATSKLSSNIVSLWLIIVADEPDPTDWKAFVVRYLRKGSIVSTAADEKYQAFQSLIVYCSTLQARFAPYFPQSLELTLSSLRLPYNVHIRYRDECLSWVLISQPYFSHH
jgi:hypothetical protein